MMGNKNREQFNKLGPIDERIIKAIVGNAVGDIDGIIETLVGLNLEEEIMKVGDIVDLEGIPEELRDLLE